MNSEIIFLTVTILLFYHCTAESKAWKESIQRKRALLGALSCVSKPTLFFCKMHTDIERKKNSKPHYLANNDTHEQLWENGIGWNTTFKSNTPNDSSLSTITEFPISTSKSQTTASSVVTKTATTSGITNAMTNDNKQVPGEMELLTHAAMEDNSGAKLPHKGSFKSYYPNAVGNGDTDNINYNNEHYGTRRMNGAYDGNRKSMYSGDKVDGDGHAGRDSYGRSSGNTYGSMGSYGGGSSYSGGGGGSGSYGGSGLFGGGSSYGGGSGLLGNMFGISSGVGVGLPLGLGDIGIGSGLSIGKK